MVDPLLDEKLVLVLSSSFLELATEGLKIDAIREAYGSTRNEGICYEYCSSFSFQSQVRGDIYIGMDGYTKILLLPYFTKSFDIDIKAPEMVRNATNAFIDKLSSEFVLELNDILPDVIAGDVENHNHRLIPLPDEKYRKYTVIFFLKDGGRRKYLGRVYLHLALNKSDD